VSNAFAGSPGIDKGIDKGIDEGIGRSIDEGADNFLLCMGLFSIFQPAPAPDREKFKMAATRLGAAVLL
jgi:hypothetical protein